jgi:hypothetical protein
MEYEYKPHEFNPSNFKTERETHVTVTDMKIIIPKNLRSSL